MPLEGVDQEPQLNTHHIVINVTVLQGGSVLDPSLATGRQHFGSPTTGSLLVGVRPLQCNLPNASACCDQPLPGAAQGDGRSGCQP